MRYVLCTITCNTPTVEAQTRRTASVVEQDVPGWGRIQVLGVAGTSDVYVLHPDDFALHCFCPCNYHFICDFKDKKSKTDMINYLLAPLYYYPDAHLLRLLEPFDQFDYHCCQLEERLTEAAFDIDAAKVLAQLGQLGLLGEPSGSEPL